MMKTFEMNKKAISHIEMIVSFTIFLVSALFVFSFLNPIRQPDISSSLLKAVESGIEGYSTTLLDIPVIIDDGVDISGCFKIESPFESAYQNNIFVKNMSRDVVGFKAESSGCSSSANAAAGCISIDSSSSVGRIYYIYNLKDGEEIDSPTISCSASQLPVSSYEFSIPRVKEIYLNSTIGDKTLNKLKSDYENDYDSLRDKFNFPREADFALVIKKQDTNIVKMELTKEKPEKVVVKAKEIPITILEKLDDGEIVEIYADMSIQVW